MFYNFSGLVSAYASTLKYRKASTFMFKYNMATSCSIWINYDPSPIPGLLYYLI